MIDTETFQVTDLASDSVPNARLSLSADASTLLCSDIFGFPVQELRINLDSLSALPSVPLLANQSLVLEGLNSQAYVAGAQEVYQFDASTGELQQTFAKTDSTSPYLPAIAISPDRRTLYVARSSTGGGLSSYDIATPVPMLLHQLSGSFYSVAPSRDGQSFYYVNDEAGGQSLVKAPLPILTPGTSFASSLYLGPTAEGLDGAIYQSIYPIDSSTYTLSGFYSVFDPIRCNRPLRFR